MNYTENLSLGLPEYGESADVADLNRNSGILDAYCYNTRQIECEPYDSTKTYMSGDLAIHNEVIYECNTDNTTGTWDDSKWDSTTLAEQIAKAKQSGGGAEVTKEASGNPIELTDAASAPMVKCVTQITGSQDLHGYDKPWVGGAEKNKCDQKDTSSLDSGNLNLTYNGTFGNVTANKTYTFGFDVLETNNNYVQLRLNNVSGSITNWGSGALVSGTRKTFSFTPTEDGSLNFWANINTFTPSTKVFDNIQLEEGSTATAYEPYSNICPITAYTEGEIEVRGKNLWDERTKAGYYNTTTEEYVSTSGQLCSNYMIPVSPSTSFSFVKPNTRGDVIFYDKNGVFISSILNIPANGVFTTPNNCHYININLGDDYGATYNNDVMIELGSAPTAYEPYNATTHTTTYPSAIYRGSEDVVNGEVTSDWKKVVFDGTENWQASYQNGHYRYTNVTISDIKKPSANNTPVHAVTNMYQVRSADLTYMGYDGFSVQAGEIGLIYIYDSRFDAENKLADFKSALSQENLVVAYELSTPQTSSVTPTNLPIKSLSGYSHIESTTGEMEVEYITENYQSLVDLIQSSNGHTYSTQEQVVGKWIDGSDVYEQTFTGLSLSVPATSSNSWTNTGISLGNISTIIDGSCVDSDGQRFAVSVGKVNSGANVGIIVAGNPSQRTIDTLIIRCTKTTQTRSLSAPVTSQKAQIEPLTDKTEEVPTEEEKAVNEEENNDETR